MRCSNACCCCAASAAAFCCSTISSLHSPHTRPRAEALHSICCHWSRSKMSHVGVARSPEIGCRSQNCSPCLQLPQKVFAVRLSLFKCLRHLFKLLSHAGVLLRENAQVQFDTASVSDACVLHHGSQNKTTALLTMSSSLADANCSMLCTCLNSKISASRSCCSFKRRCMVCKETPRPLTHH